MDGMCKMGGQAMMLDDIVKKKMSKFVLACNQMLDNRFYEKELRSIEIIDLITKLYA